MSVTWSPNPVTPVSRGIPFSPLTVTMSYSPGSVTSVTATLNDTGDEIEISNGSNSFTISGRYLSGWEDIFNYYPGNESSGTSESLQAINISNMPPDQNLYNLTQDMAPSVTKTYSVEVSWTDSETFSSGTTTVTVPHEVQNDWEAIRYFMDNYNYNGPGGDD
jgi:hypothetical protein